ncbi:MAG: hypothetical protein IGS48_22185 [Oscillatoriales cyanobacterium C42_A2020_001]|nr:hypothetical protein [Leptolyngbyaceae cyanobacterium C42_A2020_001]
MRNIERRPIEKEPVGENSDYLRGYRDGVRDRRAAGRPRAGDGLLGALLAIALMAGVGYLGYNYATTGQVLPADFNITLPQPGNQ